MVSLRWYVALLVLPLLGLLALGLSVVLGSSTEGAFAAVSVFHPQDHRAELGGAVFRWMAVHILQLGSVPQQLMGSRDIRRSCGGRRPRGGLSRQR